MIFGKRTRAVGIFFASGYNRDKYAFKVDKSVDLKLGDEIELDDYINDSGKPIIGIVSNLTKDEEQFAEKRLKGTNRRTGERIK